MKTGNGWLKQIDFTGKIDEGQPRNDHLPKRRMIQYRGLSIGYLDAGKPNKNAAPLLFLHGYGSSAIEWENHIHRFCRNRRCVAVDLPGHGSSEIPPLIDATLEYQVDSIVAVIRELKLSPVIAVGHSMGGRISGRMALKYPKLIKALVFVNAPADQPLPASLKWLTRSVPLPLISLLLKSKKLFSLLTKIYSSDMVLESNELTRRKAQYLRTLRNQDDFPQRMSYFTKLGRDVLNDRLVENLYKIKKPALIIWTRNDHTCPLSSAHLLADRLSDNRLVIIDQCAHNPHLEKIEEFNRILSDFIAGMTSNFETE